MKHTPGPWICEDTEEGHLIKMGEAALEPEERRERGIVGILSHHEIEYNHMCYYEDDLPEDGPCNVQAMEAEANARLIAAAPELLEALKEVESAFGVGIYDSADFMGWLKDYGLDMIWKAIAKAKGETT